MTDTADCLPKVHFASKDLSIGENYSVWRKVTNTLFDIDAKAPGDTHRFYADLTSYSMGCVLLGHARSTAQRFSRSTSTIARSGIDHIIVQLYIVGGYHGTVGTAEVEVRAGDVCVLDCAETLETQATDFENLTLAVPRTMLESKLPRLEAVHGLVLRSGSTWTEILSRHLLALFELAPQMTVRDGDRIAVGTVALLVACLQGEIEARDDQTGTTVSNVVLRIRRHIDERLSNLDLAADQVAAELALSRATLYRLFEPFGGVADYIRSRRLRRAFFALRATELRDRRIGEIAQRCGFSSMGTFTRAFKAAYGITPAELRNASLVNAVRNELDNVSPGEGATITRWMHEITADRSLLPPR